ncbi:MAG: methyltransferase domain-containing protein [SAR324 cluster bacterium]|nr:methyltransferase domain-containing protein [SAR324 cluster bacterium]
MTEAKVTLNPEQYLKFEDHRLRPAMDLLGRIDLESPGLVYDLGCGTGNTTKLLADRWPDSRIVGIDSSAEMLKKARKSYANLEFIKADLESWNPQQEADLFYSNAALHWLGNHESLFIIFMSKIGLVLAKELVRVRLSYN